MTLLENWLTNCVLIFQVKKHGRRSLTPEEGKLLEKLCGRMVANSTITANDVVGELQSSPEGQVFLLAMEEKR